MAATIRDVARIAGVSIKTVSNVVNEHPHVREETRTRVLAAVAELGYKPNVSARSLRSGRSGVIGLAVPELSLNYFARLADEVIQAAEARGLVVLIEQTGGNRQRELEVLRGPRLALTDGMLLCPLGLRIDDAAAALGTPLVLLGERTLDGRVDTVTMQNAEAARAATEHLLALGRRRIAVIGAHDEEGVQTAGLRLAGYRAALDAAGIAFDEKLIAHVEPWHRSNGADAMRRLLDSGVQFDGIFAMNDELALGALRILQDAGRRVPQDVAVIGFDDADEGRYSIPSLSTVDPGHREIADAAVGLLVGRIADGGRNALAPRAVSTPFRIVSRESTAA